MEHVLWTEVAFGSIVGLLTSVMFYTLATRTDVFGLILGSVSIFSIEIFVCFHGGVSLISFGVIIAPGILYTFRNDRAERSIDEIINAVKKRWRFVKLIFYKFIGKNKTRERRQG